MITLGSLTRTMTSFYIGLDETHQQRLDDLDDDVLGVAGLGGQPRIAIRLKPFHQLKSSLPNVLPVTAQPRAQSRLRSDGVTARI